MHRKTTIVITVLLVAALSLSAVAFGGGLNCCMVKNHSNGKPEASTPATQTDDVQTASVEVTEKGFQPASLKLKAGVPAKVTFTRKSDETCATEVVIKEYNIERKLPLNEPVTVEFTPRKGEFTFGCGMKMLSGKLVVE
jgi:plastocyanin domain-containing protein